MTDGIDDTTREVGTFSRRSLIATSAGVATTVAIGAAAAAPPSAIASTDVPAVAVAPTTSVPADPIVAYVHDAARGEVTVVSGTNQRTFRDHALVQRLVAAADAMEA